MEMKISFILYTMSCYDITISKPFLCKRFFWIPIYVGIAMWKMMWILITAFAVRYPGGGWPKASLAESETDWKVARSHGDPQPA